MYCGFKNLIININFDIDITTWKDNNTIPNHDGAYVALFKGALSSKKKEMNWINLLFYFQGVFAFFALIFFNKENLKATL